MPGCVSVYGECVAFGLDFKPCACPTYCYDVPPSPGDSIQHDLEVTCPKCLQPYKDHKGDEVEVVCPPSPPRAMVTGGALLRLEPAVPPAGFHAVPVPSTAYALWLETQERSVMGGTLLRMEVSRDDAWLQTYYDGLALLDHAQARHRRLIEDFFG